MRIVKQKLFFIFILTSFAFVISSSFASAHAYGFDPSYTNYSLNATVIRDGSSGNYIVSAEFALCKRDISTMVFPSSARSGIGWCIGNSTKCCGGGLNETTKECNTLSCGFAYQASCNIFGKSTPIKNCYRPCMLYPQEAANYEQVLAGAEMINISNDPRCSQYGVGKSDAYVWRKTFVLDSLTNNTLVSAGAVFRRSGNGDGWSGVPMYIKPLDYYNPINPQACTSNLECTDNNICTNDLCNLATGVCSHSNNVNSCDDNNPNTSNDVCSSGVCSGVSTMCTMDSECNDGNICTDDICSPESCSSPYALCAPRYCLHTNNVVSCDDNNPTTSNDRCSLGVCSGIPITPQSCDSDFSCIDADPCTIDRCLFSGDSSYCSHEVNFSCGGSNDEDYFQGNGSVWTGPFDSVYSYQGLGDFNGDGKIDIIGLFDSNLSVCLSSGVSGSNGCSEISSFGVWPNFPREVFSWKNFLVGDFDGNRKDDFFGMSDRAGNYLGFSNGSYFLNRSSYSFDVEGQNSYSGDIDANSIGQWCDLRFEGPCVPMNFSESLIADLDGDGKDDLIVKTGGGELAVAYRYSDNSFNKSIFVGLADASSPVSFWEAGRFDDSGRDMLLSWEVDGKVYLDRLDGVYINRSLVGDFGKSFANMFIMHSNVSWDYVLGIGASGEAYIYYFNDLNFEENFSGSIDGFLGMTNIIVADFNGDNNSEIIARNASGDLVLVEIGFSVSSQDAPETVCDNDWTCDIALGESINNCFSDCTPQSCGGSDFNGDGVVDLLDMVIVNDTITNGLANGNSNPSNADGDANLDGLVDNIDLEITLQNSGRTCAPPINSQNCTPNLICDPWSNCTNGVRSRGCDDGCSADLITQTESCSSDSGVNCTDSDGGIDLSVKGSIRYFYNVTGDLFYGWHEAEDQCFGNNLSEYSCDYYNSSQLHPSADFNCPNGCSNGTCLTTPGTIACHNDSECYPPILPALHHNYCNLSQSCLDYNPYHVCNNSGTINSFCSIVPRPTICTPCTNGCNGTSGSCNSVIPPTCTLDSQCNDTNVCTTDSCVSGSCSNTDNVASCDDNDPTTSNDVCSLGVCSGIPKCTISYMGWGSDSVVGNQNVDLLFDGVYCGGKSTNITIWANDTSVVFAFPLDTPLANSISWNAVYDSSYSNSQGYFFKAVVDGEIYSSKDFGSSLLTITNPGTRVYMTRTIPLRVGRNAFSIPLILDDMSISSAFSSISSKVDRMYTYDGGFKVYNPDPKPKNLFVLEPARGYVLFMKQAANLTINGSTTFSDGRRPARNLKAGWNLIGSFSDTRIVSSLLSGVDYDGIYKYNENSNRFELFTDSQVPLNDVESYWIHVNQAAIIPITGSLIYG